MVCDRIAVLPWEKKDGAEAQNRTADTRLFRPLLYQLSYLGSMVACFVER